jgi:hypothetical protein
MATEEEEFRQRLSEMIGAARPAVDQEPEPTPAQPTEPEAAPVEPEPTDDVRREVARWLLDDPSLARFLQGESISEVIADAARFHQTITKIRAERVAEQQQASEFEMPPTGDDHNRFLGEILGQKAQTDGARMAHLLDPKETE